MCVSWTLVPMFASVVVHCPLHSSGSRGRARGSSAVVLSLRLYSQRDLQSHLHVLSNPSCSTLRASLTSHGAPVSHMDAHDVTRHLRLALGAALRLTKRGTVHAFP
ncbi:uncharacterized protein SCHCODRAFT_02243453 [Schizophyllum commune H4-8]|uniref:uncharacterized protein n=1 Tax=Schizophyllum commune (strain H4-8 / FGSC 9210) TaxID=578458 RepID=UPI00215E00C2|nr:uncharacterized protein SCHCODRAFT_02243453 [Schizophyllum commune H4-8]KAI5893026.1 hypothetical protein SCHCODRAFT_02243453 [Schizophyllum commune H4-8]